jgi:hypothetical protein
MLVCDVVSVRQAHSRTRMLARLEFNNQLIYFSLFSLAVFSARFVVFVFILSSIDMKKHEN